jgi:hypothetical protein
MGRWGGRTRTRTPTAFSLALSVSICLWMSGCKKSGPTPPNGPAALVSADGSVKAELGIGEGAESQPHIGFLITRVYKREKLLDAPPWHAQGGDWTFFDARLTGEPAAPFTVGVVVSRSEKGLPLSFGHATIITPDAHAGGQFIERFATAFRSQVPPARTPTPLRATPFSIAVLGEGLRRDEQGLNGDGNGGWTALKWFLKDEALDAEVFFNFDLSAQVGEFSEKDEEYRSDLLAALATHLRDGPAADRTPATDPSLTDDGPRPKEFQSVGSPHAGFYAWQGTSLLYTETRPGEPRNRMYVVSPPALDPPSDVVSVERRLDQVKCAQGRVTSGCVIEERVGENPNIWSSSDLLRFWWIDHQGSTKARITGDWDDGHLELARSPVSTDARFLALAWWKRTNNKGRRAVRFVDRLAAGGGSTFVAPGEDSVDVVGWVNRGGGTLAVARVGDVFAEPPKGRLTLIDPASGNEVEGKAPDGTQDDSVSSDGKRTCAFRAEGREVAIGTGSNGAVRVFSVHPDDVRYTKDARCQWVGPRHVLLQAARLGLIDADTLKMNYPFPKADDVIYEFSPDGAWVVRHGAPDGIAVAQMVSRSR